MLIDKKTFFFHMLLKLYTKYCLNEQILWTKEHA